MEHYLDVTQEVEIIKKQLDRIPGKCSVDEVRSLVSALARVEAALRNMVDDTGS